ncbi:GTP-binding protein [uncultured Lutibacter sp.]|uniref:GTP-binding protein n=1 Tax=uncultured Lutibacter sp. TaxID=437739 RepID=UPI00262554E2|nr:GTP-binding protein [uncultured Lutibacter sp.]
MEPKKNSDIHLRPRFKLDFNESQQNLISKFKDNLKDGDCKYCSKIVDGHIVIDVPVEENHFWSPQLNIEIEKVDEHKTIVKGLFGPKPQVWTLFMFFHFAVAVAFIGFAVMAYVQWSLNTDNSFALTMVITLPIVWVIMYVLGRIGKKTGHKQMEELNNFLMKTLEKK